MIDLERGRPSETPDSGRKMASCQISPAAALTDGRTRVGRPTTAAGSTAFYMGIAAALAGVADIEVATRTLSRRMRADRAGAERDLQGFVESVCSLSMLTNELGHAAGQGVHEAEFCTAPSVCGMLGAVASAVECLVERHAAGDWAGMADSLDRELPSCFACWRAALAAIGARCVA